MVGCSVLGCGSRSEKHIEGLTFHNFPKDPNLQEKWIAATGKCNWKPTKYTKMCSKHFDDNSITLSSDVELSIAPSTSSQEPLASLKRKSEDQKLSIAPKRSHMFASKSEQDGKNKGDKMISQKAEPETGEDGKVGAGAGNEKSPSNPHQGTAERADQMDIERFEHEGGPPRRTDRAAARAEQLALEGFENEAGVPCRGERGMSQYSAMHQIEILAGELDHIPEAAFYMVGTIEDVIAKSLQLAK